MGYMIPQALLEPQSRRGVPTFFFHLSVDTAIKRCSAVIDIGKNKSE